MSIPSTKQNLSQPPMTISPRMSTGHVEKFEKPPGMSQGQNSGNGGTVILAALSKKTVKPQAVSASHNVKRKYNQSKQAMEHESSEDKDAEESSAVNQQQPGFRPRSKTISDTFGKITDRIGFHLNFTDTYSDDATMPPCDDATGNSCTDSTD